MITCRPPEGRIGTAELVSKFKPTYHVGDTVTYVCSDGSAAWLTEGSGQNQKVKSVCSSEGTWTLVQYGCTCKYMQWKAFTFTKTHFRFNDTGTKYK